MKNTPFMVNDLCTIYNTLKVSEDRIKNSNGHYLIENNNSCKEITKNEVIFRISEMCRDKSRVHRILCIFDMYYLGNIIDNTLLPIGKNMRTYDYFCGTLSSNNEIIIHSQNYLDTLIYSNINLLYHHIIDNIKVYEKELRKLK